MIEKNNHSGNGKRFVYLIGILFLLFSITFIFAAVVPDGVNVGSVYRNDTKATTSAGLVNISGGRIAAFNLTATIQNPRWKAFVGNVFGSFTLDDSTGATIYDWSLSVTTGRLYSTRNDSTLSWADIECANKTTLEAENVFMNHSNSDDNITKTFNGTTHTAFSVGAVDFIDNQCINATLNTYNSTGSQDSDFEETALYEGSSIVYATKLEEDTVGFDGDTYDFQMIVPENGLASFSGSTAYYLYIELGN